MLVLGREGIAISACRRISDKDQIGKSARTRIAYQRQDARDKAAHIIARWGEFDHEARM